MRKSLALLPFLFLWAFAQQVNLAKPEGPVVEATVASINATLRIQGCARDQEGKVVCAVQIQSTARTNQQVAISHQGVRVISARGFSYPGYLSVDGGQLEATRSVFALPAGGRATGKLVFPNVPKEETFLSALYLSGVEFRGIPIGQAPALQVQAPAATPAAQTLPLSPGSALWWGRLRLSWSKALTSSVATTMCLNTRLPLARTPNCKFASTLRGRS